VGGKVGGKVGGGVGGNVKMMDGLAVVGSEGCGDGTADGWAEGLHGRLFPGLQELPLKMILPFPSVMVSVGPPFGLCVVSCWLVSVPVMVDTTGLPSSSLSPL